MTAVKLPVPSTDGLNRYLSEVRQMPVLERDEEYMLSKRFNEHGDSEAAHRLVTSHLRLVVKIAFGYKGYGLPMADLISEGNVGLMRAVKKFDPDRGFRLATYAMWWIKAAVTEYILQSWSMVKLGTVAAQKKLFFSLGRIKKSLGYVEGGQLKGEDTKRLAAELDLPESEVVNMDRRLAGKDMSLNAPLPSEDGGEFQDLLQSEAPTPEYVVAKNQEDDIHMEMLKQGIARLPEREQIIIHERKLRDDPIKLEDLGERFGVSRERVRQLEVRAFQKLKDFMLEAAAERGLPSPVDA